MKSRTTVFEKAATAGDLVKVLLKFSPDAEVLIDLEGTFVPVSRVSDNYDWGNDNECAFLDATVEDEVALDPQTKKKL